MIDQISCYDSHRKDTLILERFGMHDANSITSLLEGHDKMGT